LLSASGGLDEARGGPTAHREVRGSLDEVRGGPTLRRAAWMRCDLTVWW
jgi:hypothetical protein